MANQTVVGWILDVSQYDDSNEIIILIKLHDDKVTGFKQRLQERIIYSQDLIRPVKTSFNSCQDMTRS
ncbi:MAG: hypothetical protein WBX01_13650 [Nitrososphaeraceae archaeon]|jgi:hypothetical protein